MTTSTLTITLSSADVDLIGIALGKLPLEQSLGLWMNLKAQVSPQLTQGISEEAPANGNDTSDNAAG